MHPQEDEVIRVSASTSPPNLGAAIAHACYEGRPPILRAIGAGAVNQAVKGVAIATQYTAGRALRLTVMLGFDNVTDGEKTVSAVIFKLLLD